MDEFKSALGETVERAQELQRHLSGRLSPEEIPGFLDPDTDVRAAIGHSLTRVGLSHLGGILLLARGEEYIPCLALFRPMMEAHVRGLWLCFLAPANEVERFVKKPVEFRFPTFRTMLRAIADSETRLSETILSAGDWKHLCDYTHGGVRLIEQSALIETRTDRFAVHMLEAIRKATTASGMAVYLFVEGAARDEISKFVSFILQEYLSDEDSHTRLVARLTEAIADDEQHRQYEDEVESVDRRRDRRRKERYVENPFE